MKYFVIFLILAFLIIFSCNKSNEPIDRINQFEEYNDLVNEVNRIYLFMPLDGCGSCIEETLRFISDNNFSEKLFLVISDYRVKYARAMIDSELHSNYNILVDSVGLSLQLNLMWSSPVVYFVDKGNYLCDSLEINMNTKDTVFRKIIEYSLIE